MKKHIILFAAIMMIAMFSFAQNVGVDQPAPSSKLDVNGNLSIGSLYSGDSIAPANGAIIQGRLGVGTASPLELFHVNGSQGRIVAHPYYPPFNGTALLGAYLSTTAGAQMRFSGPASGFADIGNDSLDNFVIETNDMVRVQVNQNGFVGLNNNNPLVDLHIKQSVANFPNPTTGGLRFEDLNGDQWQVWNSNNYLSFAYNSTRVAYVNNNTGDWVTTSDRRLKRDITPMATTLDRVLQLRPVSYHYLHQGDEAPMVTGFIAQEVEPLFPEAVHTDEDGDMKGVSYGTFGVIAIKAIQEQQEIITQQQAVIQQLLERVEALENK